MVFVTGQCNQGAALSAAQPEHYSASNNRGVEEKIAGRRHSLTAQRLTPSLHFQSLQNSAGEGRKNSIYVASPPVIGQELYCDWSGTFWSCPHLLASCDEIGHLQRRWPYSARKHQPGFPFSSHQMLLGPLNSLGSFPFTLSLPLSCWRWLHLGPAEPGLCRDDAIPATKV